MKITNDHLTLESVSQMPRYNQWLISRFQAYFGQNILEIGSGIGTLSQLLPSTTQKTLTDINPEYLQQLESLHLGKVLFCDIQKPLPPSLKTKSFDTIFTSNVLEHVEDDQKAFKNIYRLLQKGGHLLLFVPAKQSVFGELDRQLFHFRRYEKETLKAQLEKIGFKIEKIRYYNFLGFFSWWLNSKVLHQKYIPPHSAYLFDQLFTPLLYLEESLPLPLGQNLLVIAKKD